MAVEAPGQKGYVPTSIWPTEIFPEPGTCLIKPMGPQEEVIDLGQPVNPGQLDLGFTIYPKIPQSILRKLV